MKKHIIFLCSLLSAAICTNAQSASYPSIFGQNSTKWEVIYTTPPLGGSLESKANFYTDSTTTINGIDYHVVEARQHNSQRIKANLYLREDTTIGKVWILDSAKNIERVLYDYALAPEEFFTIYFPHTEDSIEVMTAGFPVINGRRHIEFNTTAIEPLNSKLSQTLYFIEGIGANLSTLAFWADLDAVGLGDYLLCSYKDGVKTDYSNSTFKGDCNPEPVSVRKINNEPELVVFPNPTSDFITIKNLPNPSYFVSITNVLGQTVYHKEHSNNILQLPVGHYPKGNYIISIQYADAPPLRQQFIVK